MNTNEYKNYSFKVKKSNLSNLTEKNQRKQSFSKMFFKIVFFKISQISQENNPVGVSF